MGKKNNINKDEVINRLKTLMKKEGLNQSEMAKRLEIRQPNFNAVINGDKPFGPNYIKRTASEFNLNEKWVKYGEEPMYVQKVHTPPYREAISNDTIKLYNVDAAANLMTIFENKEQNILGELKIPNLPKCDAAVYVRGDSMYPLLKSGDIIAFRRIHDFENVVFGEMYLIDYSINGDDFLVVKYVNKSDKEGYIKLVSYNTNHSPMDIPISGIRAMALVKASVRFNTMI